MLVRPALGAPGFGSNTGTKSSPEVEWQEQALGRGWPGNKAASEAGKREQAVGRWEMEKGKGLTLPYSWGR